MANFTFSDKAGYDETYRDAHPQYLGDDWYEKVSLTPTYRGGTNVKGYARRLAIDMLRDRAKPGDTVLDAGCGLGHSSIYLANQGFNVVGVEISEEGCRAAARMAAQTGVTCRFLAESLEKTSLDDNSVDHVVGLGALHHFIKYDVAPEFRRILKPGAEGFFADSFAENRLYHLFHDNEEMERLGDVKLNTRLIFDYFEGFDVELIPTDWFVMLDKVYMKFLPRSAVRVLSSLNFWLDRHVPLPMMLAGVIVTHIRLSR